jgi:hypothetical protein
MTSTQMSFCQNSQNWDSHDFGGLQLCVKTSNWGEVWSKVVALVNSFPTLCGMSLAHKEVRAIPGFSFGHNLCFNYPNGACEPISDIYILRAFQWHKENFNSMGFDPYNCFMKIWESIGTPTPKVGVHLRVWRFILSLSATLSRAWDVNSRAFLLALAFASPCLGHKPKVKVVTLRLGLQHHRLHPQVAKHGKKNWGKH